MRTSLCSAAISSSSGAIMRQGPHHAAQKSTMVALPSPMTLSKFASVSSTATPRSGVLHFPQTACCPLPRGGTRLEAWHFGQTRMSLTSVLMCEVWARHYARARFFAFGFAAFFAFFTGTHFAHGVKPLACRSEERRVGKE